MTWMKSGQALMGGLAMSFAAMSAGPLEGTWGGEHLRVVVDAKGATVEGDCADGHIPGPIELTPAGSFAASGTFQQHKGGPQPAGPSAVQTGAKYSGEIRGDVMTLSILPTGAAAQSYTLRKGAAVKLHRCY